MKNNKYLILPCLLLTLLSCINKNRNTNKVNADSIRYTAVLTIPDENKYFIVPAMGGIVQNIYVKNNDTINRGQKLISLVNLEYIDVQKEFIALKFELDYLKEEFKRQGELSIENVTSLKRMQKAQADYLIKESAYRSLAEKLTLIGFEPDNVLKTGPLKQAMLKSPVNGTVRIDHLSPGKFYDTTDEYIYIQTNDSLYVKIFSETNLFPEKIIGTAFTLRMGTKQMAEAVVLSQNFCKHNERIYLIACLKNEDHLLTEGLKLNADQKNKKNLFTFRRNKVILPLLKYKLKF